MTSRPHNSSCGESLTRLTTDGWKLINDTPLPVVCFNKRGLINDPPKTQTIVRRVVRSGEAWISSVILPDGRAALRACISSFRTTEEDLDRLIAALDRAYRNA